MQRRAIEDLTGLLRDRLAAAEIPAESLRGYVTPRRLAVVAEGIPATQPDRTEERRGPRVGAPQPAIDGFLRSAGLASIRECEIRDTGRGEFYFAVVSRAGRPAREVLPELIRAAMTELPWPKSMRYPASDLRWVRPLTSVLCLFDGEVLPLPLDRVPVGRTTRGHRFLSPGEICVAERRRLSRAPPRGSCRPRSGLPQRRRSVRSSKSRRGRGALPEAGPGAARRGYGSRRISGRARGRDRRRLHGASAGGAGDGDARASEIFLVLAARRDTGPAFPVRRQQSSRSTAGRRSSPAMSGCCEARLADARFFWDQDRRVPLEDARRGARRSRLPRQARQRARQGRAHGGAGRVAACAHVAGCDAAPVAARGAARQGRPVDRHGRRISRAARRDGALLRIARRRRSERSPRRSPITTGRSVPTTPARPLQRASSLRSPTRSIRLSHSLRSAKSRPGRGIRSLCGERRLVRSGLILENAFAAAADDRFRHAREAFAIAWTPGWRDANSTRAAYDFIADRLKVHLREQGVRHDLIAAVFAQVGTAKTIWCGCLRRVDALDELPRLRGRGQPAHRLSACLEHRRYRGAA